MSFRLLIMEVPPELRVPFHVGASFCFATGHMHLPRTADVKIWQVCRVLPVT